MIKQVLLRFCALPQDLLLHGFHTFVATGLPLRQKSQRGHVWRHRWWAGLKLSRCGSLSRYSAHSSATRVYVCRPTHAMNTCLSAFLLLEILLCSKGSAYNIKISSSFSTLSSSSLCTSLLFYSLPCDGDEFIKPRKWWPLLRLRDLVLG